MEPFNLQTYALGYFVIRRDANLAFTAITLTDRQIVQRVRFRANSIHKLFPSLRQPVYGVDHSEQHGV